MKNRIFFIYIILIALLISSALLSLSFGAAKLSVNEMISGFIGREEYEYERTIMLSVRLPRLLASIISGIGLSLSGVILQTVMGNDLASPNTIGVSSGAGLAAIICLSAFPSLSHLLPIGAFLGAFTASLLIMAVSKAMGGGRGAVILAGIALTSFFGAGISFLSVLDTDVLASYSAFSVGSLSGVMTEELVLPFVFIMASLLLSVCLSGRISALSLGDSMAQGLGIRAGFLRTLCLVISSLSAASVISFAGLLGFVGLVVPHITRKIVGSELKKQLTAAPLVGASLVTLSDLLGRTAFAPSEISVGIIMAFIGAPFFFIILIKRRNDANA